MRNDKDNTRRIGGLLLDLLMLSFIISLSFADVKITRGYETSDLSIKKSTEHKIVSDFDSVFGSFNKQLSKILPEHSSSLGSNFEFPQAEDARIVAFATQYLYNVIYAYTTINAP